jgi:C-terminal processing protease CtpA/Prc
LTGLTDRYLREPIRNWCNNQIQFAWLSDSVGYLRLLSFEGYTNEGTIASGLPALEAALDTIFGREIGARMRALVIDVRLNSGGSDPYALAVASRLTSRQYLAYRKQARADPVDATKWTPLQPVTIHPSDRPGFIGEIVELIGPLTVSGGETFTQALMGRQPKVVRIGENTQGVFSDMLERALPNGWRFALPNEVFRNAEGKTFDITGIPPDIPVPVYPSDEVVVGRDGPIEKALEVLGVKRR